DRAAGGTGAAAKHADDRTAGRRDDAAHPAVSGKATTDPPAWWPGGDERAPATLPRLPHRRGRDAGGARRRATASRGDVRRRAARRTGGPARAALRGP